MQVYYIVDSACILQVKTPAWDMDLCHDISPSRVSSLQVGATPHWAWSDSLYQPRCHIQGCVSLLFHTGSSIVHKGCLQNH